MDRLTSMSVFVKVVARRSFAVAARELRLSRAGVSKHVLALEQSLGVRLLNRNTRRLSLTEVGTVVHERYARILEEIDEVEASAGALQMTPRGVLRVASSVSFGIAHLAAAIADYLAKYREVSIDLVLNDRTIDLIEEGFDVAVRVGHLADSSLIARRLAPIRLVLCTSPEYLARYGAPTHPSDLQHHDCVVYIFREGHGEWRFVGPDGAEETVHISGRLRANNGNLLRVAVLKGQGIGLAPTFLVGEDLAAGRLLRLLPDYAPVEEDLAAVYPHRRQLSAKVRSFVDFLAERFAREPEWDRWRDLVEARP
jgi:DNA-binding transcriptional LysR family regulator